MDHFQTHGWVRMEGAFSAQEAAAMRDVVWRALAAVGIQRDGEAAARIERFHERVEEVDGIPLQVEENTASAGDVILMHPLLLHAPPTTHLGSRPRFLLNKDICKGVSGRAILPCRQAARRTASSCLSQT